MADSPSPVTPPEDLRFERSRVTALLKTLEAMAAGEVDARLRVSPLHDELDAIAHEYPSPGAVTDAADTEWDIAFVAADPDREAAIAFTPPYLELDATYLARGDSPFHRVGDVDRAGVRIATGATSAYTLLLKRDIRNATLVFLANDEAVEALRAGAVDAVAGLRDTLVRSAPRVPGARVLAGNITRARQAVAVPKANGAALAYLTQYLAEIKKSGFVAASIEKTGAIGASIVP